MWKYTPPDELFHHGIEGQKWGVRNGPPYPLESGQKSTEEREAEGEDTQTSRQRRAVEKAIHKEAKRIRRARMRKRIIIGALVTGTAIYTGKKIAKYAGQKTKAQVKEAKKEASELKKMRESLKDVSDADLEKKVKRLKTEKEYASLLASGSKDGKEVSEGKKFVMKVLKDAGEKALPLALAGTALYGLKAAASGNFDRKEFGEAIFNGGAKKK